MKDNELIAKTISAIFFVIFLMTFVSCQDFNETITYKDANVLFNNDKYLEAIPKYKKLTGSEQYKKDAYLHLGYCYLSLVRSALTDEELKKYETPAVDAFKTYMKLAPQDTKIEDYVYNTYIDARDYDSALRFLFDKFQQDNKDVRAIQLIIQLYEEQNKIPEAVEWYKKRCEVAPDDPNAFYSFAVFYWKNSYFNRNLQKSLVSTFVDDGLTLIEKAVELKPDFADAYTYWNLLLREKAKYVKSKRKQEKYMDLAKEKQAIGSKIRKEKAEQEKADKEKADKEKAIQEQNKNPDAAKDTQKSQTDEQIPKTTEK